MSYILDKLPWSEMREIVCFDILDGSSAAPTYSAHFIVKRGPPAVIDEEYAAYQNIITRTGESGRLIFPKVLRVRAGEEGLLLIQPVHGQTLEEVILEFIGIGTTVGLAGSEFSHHEDIVEQMMSRVFENLARLHQSLEVGDRVSCLREFVGELEKSLAVNLRDAGNKIQLPNFAGNPRYWDRGTVTPAHRDLSTVNVVGDARSVRFIDPRSVTPRGLEGAAYASPAIDWAALSVSLERKELECQRAIPAFTLKVRKLVQSRVAEEVKNGTFTQELLRLAEAVVRSAYVACRCSYCLAPEREWLYEHMIKTTRDVLSVLGVKVQL